MYTISSVITQSACRVHVHTWQPISSAVVLLCSLMSAHLFQRRHSTGKWGRGEGGHREEVNQGQARSKVKNLIRAQETTSLAPPVLSFWHRLNSFGCPFTSLPFTFPHISPSAASSVLRGPISSCLLRLLPHQGEQNRERNPGLLLQRLQALHLVARSVR